MNQIVVSSQDQLGPVWGRPGVLSWHGQDSQTLSLLSRLTEDDEDVAGLQAVGGGEEMSVSEKTGATTDMVAAGSVSDDDQGGPGELVGSGLLSTVNSDLETGGVLLSLSTLTGTGRAGEQPEQ